MSSSTTRPRVLIEDWLPVEELGIESRRERAAASALPPLSFLHVWWARRPIVASTAVVLGGLLPAWSSDLAADFAEAKELKSEAAYRAWLLRLVGIWGDAVAGRKAIDTAKAAGIKLKGNGYGYKQAFRNPISKADVKLLHAVLTHTWNELPTVADPTAGGGSIPWSASRLGLPAVANDLNGVAASVLRAGVQIPAEHGTDLLPHLRKWGDVLVRRVRESLKEYFPLQSGETVISYIWANAVPCPRTGGIVPLLTEKWLRKETGREVAIELVIEVDGVQLDMPRFEVRQGRDVDKADASKGTVKGGRATSPYDSLVIEGDYIKSVAQAGGMTQVLYAVAIRKPDGTRTFRAPTETDLRALAAAKKKLAEVRDEWTADGFLPTEEIPSEANYNRGHRLYGRTTWLEMFTARQALVHGTFGREFAALIPEIRADLGALAEDVLFELALMQGKALNWNGLSTTWDVSRQKMRSVFEKHNFSFKWTFAEFEGSSALYSWCLDQLTDAYGGIAELLDGTGRDTSADRRLDREVTVTQGSAATLALKDGSVAHLCMDPPYYDNVQYAEIADYFYVWEKRTLGRLVPEYFVEDLTDKENEAVANPARFAVMGRRKNELADLDYEAKMTAIFAESRRVLRDDGVLSVMFTHKRAEAWDTLGMGILQAGFTIEASWPVNTESEVSLHQANMNSAASTIMLVCRKRENASAGRAYLEDIEPEIREAARQAVTRFQHDGIDGVDLLLSTYGPTLSVISRHWPVYSSTPDADGKERLLRPEEALDLAREEVVSLRRTRLVGKAARVDDITDFVLMAWDIFGAREFPFDTARLLALAVGGLDVDALVRAKIVSKSAGKRSEERRVGKECPV